MCCGRKSGEGEAAVAERPCCGMAGKKKWSELSAKEKRGILILASIQLSLAATAWANLATRPAEKVAGSKGLWAAIIGINFFGPIAYFLKGRKPA